MTVPYHSVLRQIAFRSGALRGTQIEGLETSYITSPLTKAEIGDESPVSFSALKDSLLVAEERVVRTIAETGNHPLRRVLTGQTASIANEGLIPSTDANSKSIIGILGSVFDATDGTPCTEQPLEFIRRVNASAWRIYPLYHYKIDSSRIFHTRTNVKIDVCVYDAATQRTAIDNNSNMLLPDVLEEVLICGGMGYLPGDNSGIYRGMFEEALIEIRQGLSSVVMKSIPGPTLTAQAT